MSDTVQVALITAIPSTIAAVAAAFISFKNNRQLHNQNIKLEEIHDCVDKLIK